MVTTQLTPTGVGIHHVLIATDFSSCSNQALDVGLKLAKAYQAEASVVLVLPSNEFMLAGPDAYVAARDAARRDLENLKVALRSSRAYIEGSDYHLYLLEGEVAPRILNFAQEKKVDLIIVGTHGRQRAGQSPDGFSGGACFPRVARTRHDDWPLRKPCRRSADTQETSWWRRTLRRPRNAQPDTPPLWLPNVTRS